MNPTVITSTRRADDPPSRISVAVSTYNRPVMLTHLLEALEQQTLPPSEFEVVIADNGSAPATAEAITAFAASTALRIHALHVSPNSGPSGGRNVAWRECRSDVVAFTDDDCKPTPEWLERGLHEMAGRDSVVVGRTLPDPELSIGPFSRTVYALNANWLPTCNVFYLRDDLVAVGGFDESYVKPGAEDTDLGYRVRDRCERVFRFAHRALVYHDVRPSRFLDAAKETQRWSAVPRFFRTHPASRALLHHRIFWKPSHSKALLALAGLPLALAHPLFAILAAPWLLYRTTTRKPLGQGPGRYVMLPGVLVVDLLEVVAMVRGSIRYRTVVL